ncbi:MAG: hypothetical protein JXA64_01265 [Candidatus Fermentibacteraceae bacterium]|nr:hypothetical protein [Candidatus Fermentibacteraceae bacterium]MBN2607715.1 hypothetical protein [Candidatus Fermentibacteraceae bacterium]
MYPLYFIAISVILGFLKILLWKTDAVTAFLFAFIVSNIGLQGIFAFIGHFFRADEVARGIGWPTGSPFQREIAFANLSMGVLGIMSIWFCGYFWLAAIIGRSVFSWGAAYGHIVDLKKSRNSNILNAGPVLYDDILIPVVLIGLYLADTLR